jgi:UDP-N-acetylglucosamine--N-acetylmuramyl-(pentapeptide) pyrophosphoryl-undecaprenol N-acetylglucosamine transferase
MIQTIFIIWRLKPALVVGFGGYASIPAVLVASFRSIPTIIHEQNSVLGRANRFVAKRVDKIATSYTNVSHLEKIIENKIVFTGMPVRSLVEELRSEEYPVLLDSSSLTILIFGGSQGANIFSRVLPQSIDRLDISLRSRIEVIHQCRAEDTDTLVSNYRELDIKFEVSEFFSDLPEKIAQSNLVITRAGSSTLAEVTIIGRPAVVVPYPFAVDDHQTTNAREFEAAGCGWLFSNTSFTPKLFADLLKEVLFDPVILEKKANKSRNVGQVGAARRLADLRLGLISKSSPEKSGVAK